MSSDIPFTTWTSQVAHATQSEPALLPKTETELLKQMNDGLSAVRQYEQFVTAHATLWPLGGNWYELGTVWVRSEWRGHDLSAELYRELFARHPDKNILATTTNPASLRIGLRVGMKCVRYSTLPPNIWRETCCCPIEKTGSKNNVAACKLRENSCFVRVTRDTWRRLGSPAEIDVTSLVRRSPPLPGSR